MVSSRVSWWHGEKLGACSICTRLWCAVSLEAKGSLGSGFWARQHPPAGSRGPSGGAAGADLQLSPACLARGEPPAAGSLSLLGPKALPWAAAARQQRVLHVPSAPTLAIGAF